MTTALIVGSGPAAASAALALSRRQDLKITVVDIGLPFRADSLLGLVHTAPSVPGSEPLTRLGVTIRAFSGGAVGTGMR